MDPDRFMASIKRYVAFLISSAKASEKTIEFPAESRGKRGSGRASSGRLGICPKCKTGEILENTKAFYCSRWKDGCAFNIWKNALERFSIVLCKDMAGKLVNSGEAEAKGVLDGQEKTFVLWLDKDLSVKARLK